MPALAPIVARMAAFPNALRPLVAVLPDDDARWRPADGAWSIVEVLAHLADEETEDFGRRLRLILADPKHDWPPIDPEGWARDRRYAERDPTAELARFAAARAESVAWLRSLPPATDWSITKAHPRFGPIRAGDLLAAWCAHDALHLRQMAKRLHQLAGRDAGAYSNRYAGDWTP